MVIMLWKVPLPLPSVVLSLSVVGNVESDQHVPRIVTSAPPLSETSPPEIAEDVVISMTGDVDTVAGTWGVVENEISLP